MSKCVWILLLGVCVQPLHAQPTVGGSPAPVATLTILPEDVVQDSIRLYPFKDDNNRFLLTLDYSERGTNKLLAFNSAHRGQIFRSRYGTNETKPRRASTNSLSVVEAGKNRQMQQFLLLNAADAQTVLAALKKK